MRDTTKLEFDEVAQRDTRDFLELLDRNTEQFTFQIFGEGRDQNQTNLAQILQGSLKDNSSRLQELNSKCAGVFVTINETDGHGRKAENITRIRAVWQDDDNSFDGSFLLEPSFVVQSSEGKFQRYWLVEDSWPTDELGVADFRAVMRGMVQNYGHDSSASDLARVLRLPGFYHQKSEPQLVKIIQTTGNRYSRQQLVDAFGIGEQTVQRPHLTDMHEELDFESEQPRVEEALEFIPSDDYQTWYSVGAAIHHESNGSQAGYEQFDKWSAKSSKYKGRENTKRQWDQYACDHPNPLGAGTIFDLAKKNGWNFEGGHQNSDDVLNDLPITWLDQDGEFTQSVMNSLKAQFNEWGHNPSSEHWTGLGQIAASIEHMANGTLEPYFYLSSLPPGMGKSTTLCHATKCTLKETNKSAIIFLSRLEEIPRLVESMELSSNDYSVLTSREEYNRLGNPNKTDARILFTTQQMLESRSKKTASFAAMTEFHYTGSFDGVGRPRDVRVWDEAIVPTLNLTLQRYKLAKLLDEISVCDRQLAEALDEFMNELGKVDDKALVTVPEVSNYSLPEDDFLDLFNGDNKLSVVASTLWKLSGRTVRVRKDRRDNNTALDYEDILPDDLAPLLILDASGCTRKTYEFWLKDRGGLKALYSPEKSYRNLTIHHWNKGSGKSAYVGHKGAEQFDAIAKLVNSIPRDAKVLIVGFKRKEGKRNGIPDLKTEIEKRLAIDELHMPWEENRIGYLTYGKHTATNEFKDCKHVILAGIFGYPTSAIEAMARGAKEIDSEDTLSEQDFKALKQGELLHHVFQAANRGKVRLANGDDCPEGCHLHIIASGKSGVPDALLEIFPGAEKEEWRPFAKPTEATNKVVQYLIAQANGGTFSISKKELIKEAELEGAYKNASNANRRIFDTDDFESLINDQNYELVRERGKITLEPVG